MFKFGADLIMANSPQFRIFKTHYSFKVVEFDHYKKIHLLYNEK
jgi:hypothetical protein